MSRKAFLFLLVPLISLLASCTTSYLENVEIENWESGNLVETLDVHSAQSVEISPDVRLMAHARPNDDDSALQITLGIENGSGESLTVEESSFTLARGNAETDSWKELGAWSAERYYSDVYREERSSLAGASLAGAFAVADAYTTTRVRVTGDGSLETSIQFTPGRAFLTAVVANSYLSAAEDESRSTLRELSEGLLFSSTVEAGGQGGGDIFIPSDSSSPEYRLSYSDGKGGEASFIFSRSDRKAVLNPWLDQSRDRHSVVTNFAVFSNRVSSVWHISRKSGMGMYLGFAISDFADDGGRDDVGRYNVYSSDWDNFTLGFDPDPDDSRTSYDAHFEVAEVLRRASVGVPFGMNWRILPNTWLAAGLEFGFYVGQVSRGTISYLDVNDVEVQLGEYRIFSDPDESVYISPQLGLNFITNMLDFSLMLTWMIPDRIHFELGFGFAF